VVLIIAAHAYFVMAEYVLVTLRRTRLEQAAGEKRAAALVLETLSHLQEVIAAVQIGVTVAGLLLGALAEPVLAGRIEPLFGFVSRRWRPVTANGVAVVAAFLLVTYVDIVLGELVPKAVALQESERLALALVRSIRAMVWALRPFVALLNGTARLVLAGLRVQPSARATEEPSTEDLKVLIAASRRAGVLDEEEQEMLLRAFEFSQLTARQIMVPRTEVVGIPLRATREQLIRTIRTAPHTRYPVYGKSLDDIVGILYVRDLLGLIATPAPAALDIATLMRPPLFVPDSIHLDDLLARMRRTRIHFAVVMDEFGGTAGIVTMEDVIERIVGEVRDEFEPQGAEIQELPNGDALIDGLVLVSDVNARFGLQLDDEAYDTLGGLVWGELGHEPHPGDELTLDGARLRVEAMDGRRVASVRLIRRTPASPSEHDGSAAAPAS